MNDSYTHVESHVFYITENILGPVEYSAEYEHLQSNFNSQLLGHCNCEKVCYESTCKCLLKSCGENYETCQGRQQKHKSNHATASLPVFECNENCLCPSDCSNRTVQRGPLKGLEIKPCDKGFGLFTNSFISKGTFVCEYAGELITKAQASVRHQINQDHSKMNYIFCLKEHFGQNIVETLVDPSVFGNIGRYMNHSCDPNCKVLPVRCESLVPKLSIFAVADIQPGDELTFHYGSSDFKNPPVTESTIQCLCKAENCVGFMPFNNY